MQTEHWLRVNNTSNLNHEQRQNRLKALNLLNTYWKKETFPKNTMHSCKTPQIMDQNGTLCAVAFIMHNSGHQNLVREVAQNSNFAYINDIPDTHPLIHSLKECGISKKEAARIQPSYGTCQFYTPLVETHGTVSVFSPIIALLVSLAALTIVTAISAYLAMSGSNFKPTPIVLIVGITIASTLGFIAFFQQYETLSFNGENSLENTQSYRGTKDVYSIDGTHSIVYWINGAKITKFLPTTFSSLVFNIQTSSDGELVAQIPRVVYKEYTHSNLQLEANAFLVLIDNEEAYFDSMTTYQDNVLTIPFKDGNGQIEIIPVSHCQYPSFGQK